MKACWNKREDIINFIREKWYNKNVNTVTIKSVTLFHICTLHRALCMLCSKMHYHRTFCTHSISTYYSICNLSVCLYCLILKFSVCKICKCGDCSQYNRYKYLDNLKLYHFSRIKLIISSLLFQQAFM